jgi:hypothetical protein
VQLYALVFNELQFCVMTRARRKALKQAFRDAASAPPPPPPPPPKAATTHVANGTSALPPALPLPPPMLGAAHGQSQTKPKPKAKSKSKKKKAGAAQSGKAKGKSDSSSSSAAAPVPQQVRSPNASMSVFVNHSAVAGSGGGGSGGGGDSSAASGGSEDGGGGAEHKKKQQQKKEEVAWEVDWRAPSPPFVTPHSELPPALRAAPVRVRDASANAVPPTAPALLTACNGYPFTLHLTTATGDRCYVCARDGCDGCVVACDSKQCVVTGMSGGRCTVVVQYTADGWLHWLNMKYAMVSTTLNSFVL